MSFNESAFGDNVEIEMARNHERYLFYVGAKKHLIVFKLVPPGTGICHQVNLEYLGKAVQDELCLSRYFSGYGLSYDDDQWVGCVRLGCRWY